MLVLCKINARQCLGDSCLSVAQVVAVWWCDEEKGECQSEQLVARAFVAVKSHAGCDAFVSAAALEKRVSVNKSEE